MTTRMTGTTNATATTMTATTTTTTANKSTILPCRNSTPTTKSSSSTVAVGGGGGAAAAAANSFTSMTTVESVGSNSSNSSNSGRRNNNSKDKSFQTSNNHRRLLLHPRRRKPGHEYYRRGRRPPYMLAETASEVASSAASAGKWRGGGRFGRGGASRHGVGGESLGGGGGAISPSMSPTSGVMLSSSDGGKSSIIKSSSSPFMTRVSSAVSLLNFDGGGGVGVGVGLDLSQRSRRGKRRSLDFIGGGGGVGTSSSSEGVFGRRASTPTTIMAGLGGVGGGGGSHAVSPGGVMDFTSAAAGAVAASELDSSRRSSVIVGRQANALATERIGLGISPVNLFSPSTTTAPSLRQQHHTAVFEGMQAQSIGGGGCFRRVMTNKTMNDDVVSSPWPGHVTLSPTWRLKERMKTIGVCLVLALNIGTDPPDVAKPTPCAKLQTWFDPTVISRAKARERIGERLEMQYAKWQQRSKLKYRRALDPTVEEVRALCVSMRRNAKGERLLLHYNGHGVPRPTSNGEIWVFDKNHTQYIPLSVSDLKVWIGKPSIVVLDCSGASVLLPFFLAGNDDDNDVDNAAAASTAALGDHGQQQQRRPGGGATDAANASASASGIANSSSVLPPTSPHQTDYFAWAAKSVRDYIVLCPCTENQLLPMNPDYPADIFTSCLTTPIPIALRWFLRRNPLSMMQNLSGRGTGGVEGGGQQPAGGSSSSSFMDPDIAVDRVPGKLNDRKTPLGELNWIFTAVTDTIAWNVLPSPLFQRLFRQDLLVASMFRNFLLADRILRSMHCTPVSIPALPCTCTHPLWEAWDLAVETCLYQLFREGHLGGGVGNAVGGGSGSGRRSTTCGGDDGSTDTSTGGGGGVAAAVRQHVGFVGPQQAAAPMYSGMGPDADGVGGGGGGVSEYRGMEHRGGQKYQQQQQQRQQQQEQLHTQQQQHHHQQQPYGATGQVGGVGAMPTHPASATTTTPSSSSSVSSPFFSEQLDAFEIWLDFASSKYGNMYGFHPSSSSLRSPYYDSFAPSTTTSNMMVMNMDELTVREMMDSSPEQLPVVLQVLLSQAHRVRALILLRKFLDLGNFAINLALSVGIFPYVLKLLQSPIDEYKHVLVAIWAKILSFDPSCQVDLVKDGALPHFIHHLNWGLGVDGGGGGALIRSATTTTTPSTSRTAAAGTTSNAATIPGSGRSGISVGGGGGGASSSSNSMMRDKVDAARQRTMAAFIISAICRDYPPGQSECLGQNLHRTCAVLLRLSGVRGAGGGGQVGGGGGSAVVGATLLSEDSKIDDNNEEIQKMLIFPSPFRLWLCLCIANLCKDNERAQMEVYGTMDVHFILIDCLINDDSPDVRAAASCALGELIGCTSSSSDTTSSSATTGSSADLLTDSLLTGAVAAVPTAGVDLAAIGAGAGAGVGGTGQVSRGGRETGVVVGLQKPSFTSTLSSAATATGGGGGVVVPVPIGLGGVAGAGSGAAGGTMSKIGGNVVVSSALQPPQATGAAMMGGGRVQLQLQQMQLNPSTTTATTAATTTTMHQQQQQQHHFLNVSMDGGGGGTGLDLSGHGGGNVTGGGGAGGIVGVGGGGGIEATTSTGHFQQHHHPHNHHPPPPPRSSRLALDLDVAEKLAESFVNDGCPMVRYESVLAFGCFVGKYLSVFASVANEMTFFSGSGNDNGTGCTTRGENDDVVGCNDDDDEKKAADETRNQYHHHLPHGPSSSLDEECINRNNGPTTIRMTMTSENNDKEKNTKIIRDRFYSIWSDLRNVHHNDPIRSVFDAASAVVSVVHEHMLTMQQEHFLVGSGGGVYNSGGGNTADSGGGEMSSIGVGGREGGGGGLGGVVVAEEEGEEEEEEAQAQARAHTQTLTHHTLSKPTKNKQNQNVHQHHHQQHLKHNRTRSAILGSKKNRTELLQPTTTGQQQQQQQRQQQQCMMRRNMSDVSFNHKSDQLRGCLSANALYQIGSAAGAVDGENVSGAHHHVHHDNNPYKVQYKLPESEFYEWKKMEFGRGKGDVTKAGRGVVASVVEEEQNAPVAGSAAGGGSAFGGGAEAAGRRGVSTNVHSQLTTTMMEGEEEESSNDIVLYDPLSQEGRIASYRERRNASVYQQGRALADKFACLLPNYLAQKQSPLRESHRNLENGKKLTTNQTSFFTPLTEADLLAEIDNEETSSAALAFMEKEILTKKRSLLMRQRALIHNPDIKISLMKFHPCEPVLIVGDGSDGISIWDVNAYKKTKSFVNGNPSGSRMTDVKWINEDTNSLLLTGCDDGSVRVWEGLFGANGVGCVGGGCFGGGGGAGQEAYNATVSTTTQHHGTTTTNNNTWDPILSSAFFAAPDIQGGQRGSGLVLEWQQMNGQLIAGGNTPYIRCWDLEYEKCCNILSRKSDACVTTIASAWDGGGCGSGKDNHEQQCHHKGSWDDSSCSSSRTNKGFGPDIIVAGYGDGSLRVFDIRMSGEQNVAIMENGKKLGTPFPSSGGRGGKGGGGGWGGRRRDRLMHYSEHTSWIVDTLFTSYGGKNEIVSSGVAGIVKFWDLRLSTSIRTIDAQRSPMTAMAVHSHVPLLATGSHAQFIKILTTTDGDTLQTIRYHEKIQGQRVGPVSCLSFHPHKMLLAAGFTDEFLSFYSPHQNEENV